MCFNEKKKDKQNRETSSAKDRIASQIVQKIIRIQAQWARLMHRLVGGLSRPAQKICLVAFVSFSIGFCGYLIITSVSQVTTNTLDTGSLRPPSFVTRPAETTVKNSQLVAEGTYRQLRAFRVWMDSLQQSPAGRLMADSIRLIRPGLVDSVAALEKIYHSQQTQK